MHHFHILARRYCPPLLFAFALCLPNPSAAQTPEDESLQSLRALGYISHPSESRQDREAGESGLVFSRPRGVEPGYTLITVLPEARALLVDVEGKTVKEWRDESSRQWGRAVLVDGGDLLVIGSMNAEVQALSKAARKGKAPNLDPLDGLPWWSMRGKYVARYDWDGNLLFRRGVILHHDLEVGEDGRILTLGLSKRKINGKNIADDTIVVLSDVGEELERYSLFDLLTSNPEVFELPMTSNHPKAIRPSGTLDLLHSNAVGRMPFEALKDQGEIYCDSCVLVTLRHQNLIAIVDLEQEKLLWTWGPGELEFPHEARWLENGNILVFDNGSKQRNFSRLVEVDPSSEKIVWSYKSKKPQRFFTAARGTAHTLPGGNVLIASSNQGRVFEIMRGGGVVWRYSMRGEDGKLQAIRAKKYPPSLVEPLLTPTQAPDTPTPTASEAADEAAAQEEH